MNLHSLEPESSASANSATSAYEIRSAATEQQKLYHKQKPLSSIFLKKEAFFSKPEGTFVWVQVLSDAAAQAMIRISVCMVLLTIPADRGRDGESPTFIR